MNTTPFVIRALDRRSQQRARRQGWRYRLIVAWSGMRGAVSLAAALALPADFPQRDLVLFLTFAVIFTTLVLQGLTLPALIRRLDVRDDGEDEREELRRPAGRGRRRAGARSTTSRAKEWTREDTAERMRRMYEYRRSRLAARAGETDDGDGYEHRVAQVPEDGPRGARRPARRARAAAQRGRDLQRGHAPARARARPRGRAAGDLTPGARAPSVNRLSLRRSVGADRL